MKKITLLFILIFTNNFVILPAEINEASGIRLAGVIKFSATNQNSNAPVQWKVNLITKDETTLQVKTTEGIYTDEGDSVEFFLIKNTKKYTYYDVIADDGISADTIRVQLFNKNTPQKYYFENKDMPSKPVVVYIVIPGTLSPESKFVMVMHGTDRNADDYIVPWKNFAANNDYVAVAPMFDRTHWPKTRHYNLGNMFTGNNGTGSLNPEKFWSFSVVQKIQLELKEKLELESDKYDIWGHSAGAQFVHRMMTFLPDDNVRFAIPANAGWYSTPELDVQYPYGMKNIHLNYTDDDILELTQKEIIVMVGEDDTIRDDNLNTSPGADAQGENRYERGKYYYALGTKDCDDDDDDNLCKWELIEVDDVGHNHQLMAIAAQEYLLNATSVVLQNPNKPVDFILYNNYPNPFNPSTTIEYTVPVGALRTTSGNVTLKIYDILGREVETLVNREQLPGNYSVKFYASELTSGVYFYKLQVGSSTQTKKMILIK